MNSDSLILSWDYWPSIISNDLLLIVFFFNSTIHFWEKATYYPPNGQWGKIQGSPANNVPYIISWTLISNLIGFGLSYFSFHLSVNHILIPLWFYHWPHFFCSILFNLHMFILFPFFFLWLISSFIFYDQKQFLIQFLCF